MPEGDETVEEFFDGPMNSRWKENKIIMSIFGNIVHLQLNFPE